MVTKTRYTATEFTVLRDIPFFIDHVQGVNVTCSRPQLIDHLEWNIHVHACRLYKSHTCLLLRFTVVS